MNLTVTLQDIKKAQKAIAAYAKHTPLTKSQYLSELCQAEIYLKLENLQPTHSFKVRGVMNKLLNLNPRRKSQGRSDCISRKPWSSSRVWRKRTGFLSKNSCANQHTPSESRRHKTVRRGTAAFWRKLPRIGN